MLCMLLHLCLCCFCCSVIVMLLFVMHVVSICVDVIASEVYVIVSFIALFVNFV